MQSAKRKYAPVDWKAVEMFTVEQYKRIEPIVEQWATGNPQYGFYAAPTQYPPTILLEFYLHAPAKTKRKTVGRNVGPNAKEPSYIQVLEMRDEEMNTVADFVASLAGSLKAKRINHTYGQPVTELAYSLTANYADFEI